jgi:hypothetical protein
MPEEPPLPLRESYWVIPGKFLAGEHPAEFDPGMTNERLRAIIAAGIRAFVDLTDQTEVCGTARTIPPYHKMLRQMSEEDGIQTTYVNAPIEDRGISSVWTMRCILDVIDRSLADGNPLYVHCLAGIGRTGTVVGCYLKRHGIAQDNDVLEKLAHLRKAVPFARQTSPQTMEQIKMVTSWKQGA